MEWKGIQQNGIQQNGKEYNRLEWNEKEQNGVEESRTGIAQSEGTYKDCLAEVPGLRAAQS